MQDVPNIGAEFRASQDRFTTVISAFFCLLLLALAIVLRNLFAAVAGLTFAWSPRGYFVFTDAITVRRLMGDVRVPLDRVLELRRVTPEDLRGCMRLWGSGGLFGYFGLYRTSRLGKCTWYVTNRKNAVVLVTETKTVIFSPDDVDGFLAAATAAGAIPQYAASRAGIYSVGDESAPSGSGTIPLGARIAVSVAVALALAGLIAGLFAVRYAPGPPSYTLNHDALEIQDAFYPVTLKASSVNVDALRIVDLRDDTEWVPTRRTNGFANSHYQSGWYVVKNGIKVRLYRAGGERLVLIPRVGGDAPVLLQADDPDRFVQDLASEWGHRK